MLQCDLDFAVWCAKKCLHLWDAPKEVKEWLNDPKPETAEAAKRVAVRAAVRAAEAAEAAAWAAKLAAARAWCAADAAWWAADAAAWAAKRAEEAAVLVVAGAAERAAAVALDVPVGQLRLEYVTTWTEDELGQAEDDWIEPATVEIFERRARHAAS